MQNFALIYKSAFIASDLNKPLLMGVKETYTMDTEAQLGLYSSCCWMQTGTGLSNERSTTDANPVAVTVTAVCTESLDSRQRIQSALGVETTNWVIRRTAAVRSV